MSKQARYLITQSLINSWQYLFDAYDAESAYADFLAYLHKEERPASEAAQKGKDFEALVVAICGGTFPTEHKWFKAANEIAQKVKNGQFQVKVSKTIQVAGIEFLLYGRLDCLKAGVISDIKYSESYEAGKYLDSPQHPMYMELVPEANRFVFLISDGKDVFEETYIRGEYRPIQDIISEFVTYLKDTGLLKLYCENWKALGD